jgi:NO-binding membrane sensor protein with MHYT domain
VNGQLPINSSYDQILIGVSVLIAILAAELITGLAQKR